MKNVIALSVAAVVALSGCTMRVADMTVGSTKNYNINGAKFVKGQRVAGEDSYPVILFPLGIPNVKTAMDRAIEQDKCAVGLTDVVVTQMNHAFLVGSIGFKVEGDQIIDTSLQGCDKKN
ncbi:MULTISPECIES: hypothetical protein [Aeromonas]|uniref:Lipoprotein n=1 Tax=Aeromonas caviae TaxID=648 RepID=A0AA42V980_AERCA|nr:MULTISPECIES: hypothetical protein [Aeromonas]MDH1896561.1 hypothetical protein [Aeromonas caviae]QWL59879.1 hypothetical protein HQ400_18070 [Aeromonas jandaei]GJA96420.1 hypothetical protein KAM358_42520 [Aeromonas caviae]